MEQNSGAVISELIGYFTGATAILHLQNSAHCFVNYRRFLYPGLDTKGSNSMATEHNTSISCIQFCTTKGVNITGLMKFINRITSIYFILI